MGTTIENIGHQIDTAEDNKDVDQLLELSQLCQVRLKKVNGENRVILRFYEANCFSAIAKIKCSDEGYLWGWNNDEKVSEILALRQYAVFSANLRYSPTAFKVMISSFILISTKMMLERIEENPVMNNSTIILLGSLTKQWL